MVQRTRRLHQQLKRFAISLSVPSLVILLTGLDGPLVAADKFGDPINVEISNSTDTDRPIEVIDNVCHRRALAQTLGSGDSIAVQLCTIAIQGGDATVRDTLNGAERDYRQIQDGAELQSP